MASTKSHNKLKDTDSGSKVRRRITKETESSVIVNAQLSSKASSRVCNMLLLKTVHNYLTLTRFI